MQMPQTLGRHFSYQTIVSLCRILLTVWQESARDANRQDSAPLVCESFTLLRQSPLFEMCREVRDTDQQPLNAEHNGYDRLWEYFRNTANLRALPQAYCTSITQAAQLVEVLRQAAKLETDPETKRRLDIGFYTMKRQLSQLLDVGLLAELPVTAVMHAPDGELLTKFAGVLVERRQVYRSATRDSRFENWIRADLAESMGSRVFDSVRAQERHRAEICIEGLARHIGRPHPRFRRSLYADAALGIQEVFEVARQHARSIAKSKPGSPQRQRRFNASLISWITVVETLRTGILLGVSSKAST